MKKTVFALLFVWMTISVCGQTTTQRLTSAYNRFASDPQLKNALISLYVVDAATGKVIFDRNSKIGMAPASTQKVITAATALALLGKDFRYTTQLGYTGKVVDKQLMGSLYLLGSGDPTLGSWRWKSTAEDAVLNRMLSAIRGTGLQQYHSFITDIRQWEGELVPNGWIWEDIGNYYGAGADIINWRENRYDLILRSQEHVGTKVDIVGTQPVLYNYPIISEVTAAPKGTGDRSYIYLPSAGAPATVRGTIPAGEKKFTIGGSLPSGRRQLVSILEDSLKQSGITSASAATIRDWYTVTDGKEMIQMIHSEQSPPMDSIIYFFLQKSINVYGEALLRTIAAKSTIQEGYAKASPVNGLKLLTSFWKDKGIAETELNMYDGSGLSPLNRVTTHAQVHVLQYARKQNWYAGYLDAFPVFNGMKMKSGSISDVKGFCGYHRSGAGREYIFSFIVNNYNGSSSSLQTKMFRVLDGLK